MIHFVDLPSFNSLKTWVHSGATETLIVHVESANVLFPNRFSDVLLMEVYAEGIGATRTLIVPDEGRCQR